MNPFATSHPSIFNVPKRSWSILLQTVKGASRSFLVCFGLWILASSTSPAQQNCIDQDSEIIIVPGGDNILRWHGHAGRSYFVQVSDSNDPLRKWNWAPIIDAANNAPISHQVGATAGKAFFRLKYTNQIPGPGETLDTADFDQDGLSNLDEIAPPPPLLASDATDPLDPDTDRDGLTDGYERENDLDPNDPGTGDPDNGPNGDPDGDGLTNAEELALGTDPKKADTDGDGLTDKQENEIGTDPTKADTDGDSISDAKEVASGHDPKSDQSFPPRFVSTRLWGATLSTPPFIASNWTPTVVLLLGDDDSYNLVTLLSHFEEVTFPETIPSTPWPIAGYALSAQQASISRNAKTIEGRADSGDIWKTRVWMETKPVYLQEIKIPALKVSRQTKQLSGHPEEQFGTQAEKLTFTIPAGSTQSAPIDLLPDFATLPNEDNGTTEIDLVLVEVSWRAVPGFDNLDAHIHPWEPHQTNGLRIFPDFKDPVATTLRNGVDIIVKATPALAGKVVKVKAFDIDDSTDEAFDHLVPDDTSSATVIDTNGKGGNDNLTDYLNTPKAGQFLESGSWGDDTAQATIDANGEAKFTLKIGMQPGSNYKVVVTEVDGQTFTAAQVTDAAADTYLGPEPHQTSKAPSTPMLTVWRKLWVENDSMAAIPMGAYGNGNKQNDLSYDIPNPVISDFVLDSTGAGTILVIDPISDISSFSTLEHGKIYFQGTFHDIIGTTAFAPNPGQYTAKVSGDQTSFPDGSSFRLYDDDDYGLDAEPLFRQDLVNDQMKNYFKPSFVDVIDAAEFNSPDLVPLHLNEDVSENNPVTVVDDKRNLTDKRECWVCPITAAYQGPQGEDQDPRGDVEGFLMGETAPHGNYDSTGYYDHSTVFVETCRENYDGSTAMRSVAPGVAAKQPARLKKWITAVASHEMGHQPGNQTDDHPEGGLMGAPMDANLITPEDSKFSAQTIKRFRKCERWSK